ncbi:MAG: hypothetical protein NTY90_00060, partial [Candidatus Micrarchaeota archaeon]|nr:hypothetical protein [Candidatus Micrarchaeota archaeon]
MPLFRREFKGAAGAEAKRIAEMKEKALGSPVLGKQDSRVRASKYLALAMAGAIALGVGHK